ncbi:MAG: 4-hydroxythreonine-4-phosphate dehydrogenase PdxA [Acidobacteria bacterium]|nr:4-hydroxythreonine-4-phosphate dehydrogenase PdxA [Acidobacteriota bacterium]
MKPRIAISLGDPAGVGPEVALKALNDPEVAALADYSIVGDASVIEDALELYGLARPAARIVDLGLLGATDFEVGKISGACGRAAVEYVRRAAELCVAGEADAMTTAPVNKEAVTLSGMKFTGHTEFIAEVTQARDSRMLLVNDRLRVVHVTTHVSLRKACDATVERIVRTLELASEALGWLGFPNGRIAVCGLNPHAGEHGLFGEEDEKTIVPAVQAAREQGMNVEGPVPADTVFLKAARGSYDLVVAMYHDQGHIPVKLLDFERTVNVSLGLPIIRTSVDHGTAFDIAGKNEADATNMKAALRLAATMAENKAAG